MKKSVRETIGEAEARWLGHLYRHCGELFSTVFLPSHDQFHHRRVWDNGKSLLMRLEDGGLEVPITMPERLLIAAFFHDTGLVHTPGERHGRESRRLCEEYFLGDRNPEGKPSAESMEEILFVIEHHDDKSPGAPVREEPCMPDLLDLLSASDDLDAFGRMGIYRYAEIYLLRGIEADQLPQEVTANVQARFLNFSRKFAFMGDFVSLQQERFSQVYEFYIRLAQAYASPEEKPSWEPVLVEVIRDSLQHKLNLLRPDRLLAPAGFDREIRDWFTALDRENPVHLT